MLIAAATPISFIEAMSNAVKVDNAVFIFLKNKKKKKNTQIQTNFESRCKKKQNKKKKKKKNLELSLFMLYSRVNIQAETRNHLSQSQRTLKKSALVKKKKGNKIHFYYLLKEQKDRASLFCK